MWSDDLQLLWREVCRYWGNLVEDVERARATVVPGDCLWDGRLVLVGSGSFLLRRRLEELGELVEAIRESYPVAS